MPSTDPTRLASGARSMRELGYRVIDLIVDHFETLCEQPVVRRSTRRELEARLREPLPERGTPVEAVLQKVQEDVLAHIAYQRLVRLLTEDGFAFLSSTTLRARTVLRLCTINPRTTEADVEATLARLESLATGGPGPRSLGEGGLS